MAPYFLLPPFSLCEMLIPIMPIDFSEKNYLETVPNDANLISLLGVFAKGTHRGEYPASLFTPVLITTRLLPMYYSVYSSQFIYPSGRCKH